MIMHPAALSTHPLLAVRPPDQTTPEPSTRTAYLSQTIPLRQLDCLRDSPPHHGHYCYLVAIPLLCEEQSARYSDWTQEAGDRRRVVQSGLFGREDSACAM